MIRSRRVLGPLLIVLAALVAVAPQFVRGSSCGHDFDAHLVSWLDCVNAWRHGIAYPHWTPSANYGAGEPRFVFYPPLTWMLGAALDVLLPWTWAPIAFTFLVLAATGMATRALALELCEEGVATLAGCASIFSGYTLFTAYERGAFPEFTGGIWLPLLLLFALRERRPDATTLQRALDGSAAPLALVLAASWLSNAPLGVIASYLLAAIALFAAALRKTWAPVVRSGIASVLAFSAAAIYWLPAKVEQSWVNIGQIMDEGGKFENSWAFAHHADPALALHDEVLHRVSWIAVTMIAVALVSAFVAWRRGTLMARENAGKCSTWAVLIVIPAVVLLLLFPVSRPLWNLLPEWKFLQYPWRWMEAVGPAMSILFAAAAWPRKQLARRIVAGACAASFTGAAVYAGMVYFQACWVEDRVTSVVSDFRSGTGFDGLDEYGPPQADLSQIAVGLPDACLLADPASTLGKPGEPDENPTWSAADTSCAATYSWVDGRNTNPEHRQMQAAVAKSGWLILRLLSYPAWSIKVNGAAPATLPSRADGLIAVPVTAGADELTVDWTTPPDVTLSRTVSALGILAFLGVGWLERKRRRAQVS
jgi:hypothetical protein